MGLVLGCCRGGRGIGKAKGVRRKAKGGRRKAKGKRLKAEGERRKAKGERRKEKGEGEGVYMGERKEVRMDSCAYRSATARGVVCR
jgi:hypothetical protein